jgi:hypothetical protein
LLWDVRGFVPVYIGLRQVPGRGWRRCPRRSRRASAGGPLAPVRLRPLALGTAELIPRLWCERGSACARQCAGGVHGFTPALTSFVGRAAQVDEVAGLLAEYRLVTVTGPGGVGKTRLAVEVARRVAGRFADGVWSVELAAVQEPALVPAAVAVVLGAC